MKDALLVAGALVVGVYLYRRYKRGGACCDGCAKTGATCGGDVPMFGLSFETAASPAYGMPVTADIGLAGDDFYPMASSPSSGSPGGDCS